MKCQEGYTYVSSLVTAPLFRAGSNHFRTSQTGLEILDFGFVWRKVSSVKATWVLIALSLATGVSAYSQDSTADDAIPALLSFVTPAYPEAAREQRMMGTTVSRVTVTKAGHVSAVQTVSAHPVFEKYVLDALKQWRFNPSAKEHTFEVAIRFEMHDQDCDEPLALETWVSAELPRQVTVHTGLRCAQVSTEEPGVYELAELFKYADAVALVKVVSGDTENYSVAVYKAEIVKAFKGAAVGQSVFYGPFVGTRLGAEYILFLQNARSLTPKNGPTTAFGTVPYAKELNLGYGSMEVVYKCVFDGADVSQQCDTGVRVCTDYIKLPKDTPTFPPAGEETPFGCRWIRKTLFLSLLESLQKAGK